MSALLFDLEASETAEALQQSDESVGTLRFQLGYSGEPGDADTVLANIQADSVELDPRDWVTQLRRARSLADLSVRRIPQPCTPQPPPCASSCALPNLLWPSLPPPQRCKPRAQKLGAH